MNNNKQFENDPRFVQFAVDHAVDAAFWMGPDGKFVYVNNKACLSLGYLREELLQLYVYDVDPDFPKNAWKKHWDDVKERGSFTIESQHKTKNGHIFPVEVTVNYLEFDGKEYNCAFARDVTQKKLAAEALRSSEDRFRRIFENMQDAYLLTGLDGEILLVNKFAAKLLKYKNKQELMKCNISRDIYVDPNERKELIKILRSKGKVEGYHLNYKRKDGVEILVECNIQFVYSDEKKPVAVEGIVRDITEKKRIEDELKRSESLFRAIFEQAAIGVAQIDSKTGKFIKINQKYCDILGYTSDEMYGLDFQSITHPEDLKTDLSNMKRLLKGEIRNFSMEKRYRCKDGSIVWVSLSVSPMWQIDEKPSTHIAVVEDITERKQLEEKLLFTQFAVDHAADSSMWIDSDGGFVYVNDKACSFLEYSREEMLDRTVLEVDPTFSRKRWLEFWKTLKEKKAFTFESLVRTKSGKIYPIEISSNYLEYDGKEYNCSFVRDITERKKAHEALEKSEEKFRKIVESSPMGMHFYKLDSDERLIFQGANPTADSILGVNNDQFVGLSIEEAFPPLKNTEVPVKYKEVAETGNMWKTEMINYDDEIIKGAFEVYAFQTVPGSMAVMFLEITERKKTEEALEKSKMEYEDLYNNAPDMFVSVDPKTARIIQCNDTLAKATVYTRDEIMGMKIFELYHPDCMDDVKKAFQTFVDTGEVNNAMLVLKRKDGSKIDVMLNVSAIRDEKGNILHSRSSWRDITDYMIAERKLEWSESNLRNAQRIAHLGSWEMDVTTGRSFWTDEFFRICGYKPGDIEPTAENGFKIIHPDDRDRAAKAVQDAIDKGEKYSIEKRIVRPDGEIRYVLSQGEIIYNSEKKPDKLIGSFLDITERKIAEQNLRDANKKLADRTDELSIANEELSQYAYVVSHDVRAPLRAIHNYSDFLMRDLEDSLKGKQKRYLNGLKTATEEAEELVNDLLELSRVGRGSVLKEDINVGKLIKELLANFDLQEDVEILMPKRWPNLKIEPVFIKQLFQNLIDNGIKFNDSKSKKIELGWSSANKKSYEFFVKDNGIGIKSDYNDKIFQVFERLHTRKEYEGTGIGLAIVNKIVKQMKGTLKVKSELGKGSTFYFVLPKT
ncbi:PAS domain S-box protein [candidate division KSB1 bacterium]